MPHTLETRRKALIKMQLHRAIWLLEQGGCVRCGSTDDPQVHHRNKAEKISHNVWSWRAERRIAELAKCEVLCQRCHARLHNPRTLIHGKSMYTRGCRCLTCRRASTASTAAYRKARAGPSDATGSLVARWRA